MTETKMWERHTVAVECSKCRQTKDLIITTELGEQVRNSDMQTVLHRAGWWYTVQDHRINDAVCPECCEKEDIKVPSGGIYTR